MHKRTNPTPRRSAAEWRRLVSRWERSGQTADVFAERHELTRRSLLWWRWKLRSTGRSADDAGSGAKLTFVPLAGSPPEPTTTRWVLQTAAGVRLEMSGATGLVVDGLGAALERLRLEA